MGLGPIEYLTNWRVALAKDELSCGTKSIGEIAVSVGFHSSSAFSTAFTRAVGCSPNGLRKAIRSLADAMSNGKSSCRKEWWPT